MHGIFLKHLSVYMEDIHYNGLIRVKYWSFTTSGSNGAWGCSIFVSGYTPVMYSLIRGFSGFLIIGSENFDINNSTISGYSNANGNSYSVSPVVLYIKTECFKLLQ